MIRRYNYLKIHIKAEQETLDTLYELCMASKSTTRYKEIIVQETHKAESPQEKTLIKIVEIRNKVEKEQEELVDLYTNIKYILTLLTDRDAYILERLDLNDAKMDDVADDLKIKSLKYLGNKLYEARKHFKEKQDNLYTQIDGKFMLKEKW